MQGLVRELDQGLVQELVQGLARELTLVRQYLPLTAHQTEQSMVP